MYNKQLILLNAEWRWSVNDTTATAKLHLDLPINGLDN